MKELTKNSVDRQRIRLKNREKVHDYDRGNLNLADILDTENIQSLMDNFYNLTHIPMSIIDSDGNVLVKIGWQDICTKFHRVHSEACKNCVESDTEFAAGIPKGEFKLYRCKNNMWDIATPLIIGDKHLGNLFSGQFFFEDEQPDYGFFRKQAKKYGFNEEEYIKALDTAPRLSKKTVSESMAFLMKFADIVSQMSYNNIMLSKSLNEKDKLMNSLQKSEERYRILVNNLEEKVEERTRELKKAIDELNHSNQELQQFAYVISHDLQEPLRTIASFTQLLEYRYKNKLDNDADEFIEYIVDASALMKQMIVDLLDYSRIETHGKEYHPVDMEKVLNEVILSLHDLIERTQAEITHDPLPIVITEKDQIHRVFQNLIGNAIKFKKPDKFPSVHISARKKGSIYVFSVSDNGIGIEKQNFQRIFTVFQRLNTRDEYEGTGMGLAIVKRIIEKHGGRIWLESEHGEGTTFYFTLPIDESKI
ncbi:sensor histidine kinase [Methanobacterium sp.]|uniref:sensor histidine kinase n=1 Tax=Methanobacterium sp. TaxID=2164 RepID=UPI003C70E26E